MEGPLFDTLTRDLVRGASRRRVLTGLVAGFLGTLPLAVGHDEASAKKKGKGKPKKKSTGCPKGQKECNFSAFLGGPRCIPQSQCCTFQDCVYCKGEVCQPDGSCRCNPGTVDFNGVCGFKPDCLTVPDSTGNGPAKCCSKNAQYDAASDTWTCLPGKEQCLSHADCALGTCLGFMCPELLRLAEPGCPY